VISLKVRCYAAALDASHVRTAITWIAAPGAAAGHGPPLYWTMIKKWLYR
jgi:hypothetical protein